MMHRTRRWCLNIVASAEELAPMLVGRIWTRCSAFAVMGYEQYLFLNDATSEDGAQEYAVLQRLPSGGYRQIESITFSWCDEGRGLLYVKQVLAGEFDR